MKKQLFTHILAFFLSVCLAIALLLAGSCLPQASIDDNIRESAEGMLAEGGYPTMADHSFASMLDYVTDALILAESKATSMDHWQTIFTNPLYTYGNETSVEDLYQYSHDTAPEPTGYYVQYWMGFRPLMRLLLSFLDYYQILRYTAVVFFVLLAAVMCSVADHINIKAAFLFALAIIFVRPHVIAVSLQFSCCFLLAFLAMLAVPRIHRNRNLESLFFLELGIATQYFDFYTTPIITFALPMTYLYLLDLEDPQHRKFRRIGANAATWSAGYGLMWLAKLVLTTLFTNVNALAQGFASFSGRIGIEKEIGMESYYNPVAALRGVFVSLYSDREGKLILLGGFALICLVLLFFFLRNKHTLRDLLPHSALLLIAALPVIWFMVAAQPTANHHWFQYRGICASFWAGFLYLQLLFQTRKKNVPHK